MTYQPAKLGDLLTLEYGSALPEHMRSGFGSPVFGSNGEVGRHAEALVKGPGIIVGRKGSVGEVRWSAEEFWPIDTAYYVVPKDGVDLRWLYWLLGSLGLTRLDAATGVPGLNRNDAYGLSANRPSPTEQRRIAAVLDTVDEAIAKTEAVIAKLKQVRAGLLHDLLTRGLDEHGQLRDPMAHPAQFQDSPLGRIPREWDVKILRECLTANPQNGIYKPESAIGRGALLVGQTSITEDRLINFGATRRAEVTPSELQRCGLQEQDVLVSRVFATVEGVGKPALVPVPPEPAVYESNMMRLRVDRELIAPQIAFHWLQSPPVRRRIVAGANSSNQTSINQRALNLLPIGVPRREEQQRILAVIAADRQLHRSEEALATKLRVLRNGIMADLLTGCVRVPVHVGA